LLISLEPYGDTALKMPAEIEAITILRYIRKIVCTLLGGNNERAINRAFRAGSKGQYLVYAATWLIIWDAHVPPTIP